MFPEVHCTDLTPNATRIPSSLTMRWIASAFVGPIFGRHRSMERNESRYIGEMRQQAGDIAVSDEDFGMRFDLLEVKLIEQIIRPIATTCADDCAHVIALEHCFQFSDAAFDGTGEVDIAVEYRVVVERTISGTAQGLAADLKVRLPDITGGRDDADRVPGAKGGRLDELDTGSRHGRTGDGRPRST